MRLDSLGAVFIDGVLWLRRLESTLYLDGEKSKKKTTDLCFMKKI
jgi:hypothetical protein